MARTDQSSPSEMRTWRLDSVSRQDEADEADQPFGLDATVQLGWWR